MRPPPRSTLFPYTTLFRSLHAASAASARLLIVTLSPVFVLDCAARARLTRSDTVVSFPAHAVERDERLARLARDLADELLRSEEHTSELQSRQYLVCRLLLDAATTQIYTLSLHDALPISARRERRERETLNRHALARLRPRLRRARAPHALRHGCLFPRARSRARRTPRAARARPRRRIAQIGRAHV